MRPTREFPKVDGPSIPTLGLAPGGVYRAARVAPGAGALLPHRFTLACARGPSAVCSLLHFPSDRSDWLLASTLPCGVPTFLEPVEPARGHPTSSSTGSVCHDAGRTTTRPFMVLRAGS